MLVRPNCTWTDDEHKWEDKKGGLAGPGVGIKKQARDIDYILILLCTFLSVKMMLNSTSNVCCALILFKVFNFSLL